MKRTRASRSENTCHKHIERLRKSTTGFEYEARLSKMKNSCKMKHFSVILSE